MTTRNLDVALHIGASPVELPEDPPMQAGYVLTALNAPAPNSGDKVTTQWRPGGGAGGAMVPATKPGQVLVSGQAPIFPWQPEDGIDAGRW